LISQHDSTFASPLPESILISLSCQMSTKLADGKYELARVELHRHSVDLKNGNGTSTVNFLHSHEVINGVCQPSPYDGHVHPLEKTSKTREMLALGVCC